MKDLWPEDIGRSLVKPPKVILEEQGSILASRTTGIVQAVVDVLDNSAYKQFYGKVIGEEDTEFLFRYSLYAAGLSYRTPIILISHSIALYPVHIFIDGGAEDERRYTDAGFETHIYFMGDQESVAATAESAEDFERALAIAFSNRKVGKIINSLISQSV
ncbi:hypothetical protein [Deinococcus pimensis]|uniref:hypothetical protein n=1 Tax=Deinococcus pimensis TaxID=309888 RepID=UPI0012FC58A4|nr:hypothetical protein [Deinococcus pimensis]